jgi:hypothetical protein
MPDFQDDATLADQAMRALDGTGYHFYLIHGQVRPDVTIARDVTMKLLAATRADVETAERYYRREFLPPPSREKPRPDPLAVAAAQDLERLGRSIASALTAIKSQLIPENALLLARAETDAAYIAQLTAADQRLLGQAALLRSSVAGCSPSQLAEMAADLLPGGSALAESIAHRHTLFKVSHGTIAPMRPVNEG